MNKYQEALDYLISNGTHETLYSWGDEFEVETEHGEESRKLLQELVDKHKEDSKYDFANIVRNLLEHLIEYMYENGVSEGQEVSYSKNGVELKLTFEMIEKEEGAEDNGN